MTIKPVYTMTLNVLGLCRVHILKGLGVHYLNITPLMRTIMNRAEVNFWTGIINYLYVTINLMYEAVAFMRIFGVKLTWNSAKFYLCIVEHHEYGVKV